MSQVSLEIALIAWLPKSNGRAHNFPNNGVFLAINRYLCDFWHFLENAFNFRRIHFLSANVNNFRLAPENTKILAVYFDFIAGIEPSVRRKRTWRIEVA